MDVDEEDIEDIDWLFDDDSSDNDYYDLDVYEGL